MSPDIPVFPTITPTLNATLKSCKPAPVTPERILCSARKKIFSISEMFSSQVCPFTASVFPWKSVSRTNSGAPFQKQPSATGRRQMTNSHATTNGAHGQRRRRFALSEGVMFAICEMIRDTATALIRGMFCNSLGPSVAK